jgi:hypothetical protein
MPQARTPQEQAALKRKLEELRKSRTSKPAPVKPQVTAPATPVKRGLDYKKLLEDRERVDSGSNDFLRASKLPKGQTKIRFMMNPDDASFYGFRIGGWIPNANPDDSQQSDRIVSPLTTAPTEYCPVRKLSEALKKYAKQCGGSRSKQAAKLSDSLYPKSEFLSNVLVFKPETGAWEPVIFQYGVSIFKALVEGIQANLDPEDINEGIVTDEMNFADSKYGRVVVISKTGEGLATKYSVNITPKTRPITREELAARKSLVEYCQPNTAEELEGMLCDLLGMDSFDSLIANLDSIVFPMDYSEPTIPVQQGRTAKPPRRQAASEKEYDTEAASEYTEETETPIPTCIGSFGSPDDGFSCETCPFASECEQIGTA